MKIDAKQKKYNKIAIVLLIVLLCNFLLPIYKCMADEKISKPEEPLALFFCSIGDIIMNVLQKNITGIDGLKYNGEYALRYSPGIIFSGRLAAFDINFISPETPNEERYSVIQEETLTKARSTILITDASEAEEEINDIIVKFYTTDNLYESSMIDNCEEKIYTPNEDLIRRRDVLAYATKFQNEFEFYDAEYKELNDDISITEDFCIYSWWFKEEESITTKYIIYMSYSNKIQEELNKSTRIYQIKLTETKYEKKAVLESIAGKMQNTIATWYNVSREIALVGLLSVLVYVAIRGIISGSAGDKAKYKKMLIDWLVAMIIVMTLHYIISIILSASKAIADIFGLQVINEDGIDVIFSNLRNSIGNSNFMSKLINTVMYYYLVFMTIKFTVMYFKRVIYMAFLTMIAPLIGLTYPLDKIKDGQAQAFTMWIREFVFNALLQPLHLILYYVFIGSATMSDFAKANPFFALVVLGFMQPAEKMLRKMFGFDKAGKLGNLESAIKGATVMNMLNQLKAMGGKGRKPSAGGKSTQEVGKVRTAENSISSGGDNPYKALMKEQAGQATPLRQNSQPEQAEKTKSQQKKLEYQRRMENKKKEQRRQKSGESSNNKTNSNNNTNYTGNKSARQTAQNNQKGNKAVTSSELKNQKTGTQTGKVVQNNQKGNKVVISSELGKQKAGTQTGKVAQNNQKGNKAVTSSELRNQKTGTQTGKVAQNNQKGNKAITLSELKGQKTSTQTSEIVSVQSDKTEGEISKRNVRKPAIIRKVAKVMEKPVIRGCASVAGKTLTSASKTIVKGGLRVAGMATLGTIGLAAGIATGEMEKAFAGAVAGISAGSKVGGSIASKTVNVKNRVVNTVHNARQTYENERYGEKEVERRKKISEFKQTKKYKNLLEKFSSKEEKETIDKYVNSGIMDVSKIKIALTNNYSIDNNIAYINMAKLCPAEIFEDREKFNVYLESHGISKTKANEIYKIVKTFK